MSEDAPDPWAAPAPQGQHGQGYGQGYGQHGQGYGQHGYGHGYGYGYGHGYPGYPVHGGHRWPVLPLPPRNGLGAASLVLGIVAAIGFCLWPVAFVCGVLAVVLGVLGRGKARRGEATNGGSALAGIVCGAVGVALAVALVVVLLVVPDALPDEDSGTGGGGGDGYNTSLTVVD
ncbi:hypothetical protein QFZ75_002282 [Streptomyces sp. V3I8]|uniref:DUF4190 domain-containing protein n=1 Tax=Streptomyces sp. V3I8 TaxID=3042279 RepID=UPI002784275D|nr:DUF4190 domain-containing protein [Streptomyces sp. V3I8]MDQ1035866.1 hypothetical protein [Streptomyces sp. V3I8]